MSAYEVDLHFLPSTGFRYFSTSVMLRILNYNKAIELGTCDADLYENRGRAYYFLRYYKDALADFNKALEMKPDEQTFQKNRETAFKMIKQKSN